MKVRDVVSECLHRMGEYDFTTGQSTLNDEQKELQNKLVSAIDIAYKEVLTQYSPLYCTQTITFTNNRCARSALTFKMLYPLKLTVDGEKIDFLITNYDITARINGQAEFTYAYLPTTKLTIQSEVPDYRLTQSALCVGALGEYYFQAKVFDLAKSFDAEFRAKMSLLKYKGREITIKERRWQA